MSEVYDNVAQSRFELEVETTVAFAAYRRAGGIVTFTHTVVPEAIEGRGIGKRLIRGALQLVRQEGLKVIPVCLFVSHYLDSHSEERDLLAS